MITVSVRVGSRSYKAYIGPKLLGQMGEIVREHVPPARCAIISDANVAELFGARVDQSLTQAGYEPVLITIPAGEKSKSLAQAGEICERMTAARLDWSSLVVALGGGVVGDLAGFVAAIYHRGIPYVQVPTTLLAQVDSSIGGKTAVNTIAGKNLIGAVHQPVAVISDIELLQTLPAREMRQGFAEVIKHATIRAPGLFDFLENFDRKSDFESLVRQNVEIKAEFVAADEQDKGGTRALLNFGHTVGHAIEQANDYRDLLHGEAVSLGIVAACEISVRKAGLPDSERTRILSLLEQYDLPTRLPENISREKILRALPSDKKFERGQVRFIVVSGIGSARLTNDVTMDDIREAILRL